MKRPCQNCPFLRSQVDMLRPGRKREIARTLRQGAEFPCHKTLDYNTDDGEGARTDRTAFCAGALLTMENGPGAGARANQMVRISERLGMLDVDALEGHELVFDGLTQWTRAGREQAG